MRMLALCPPAYHELLRLKRQGLPLAKIASRTGLHEGSVRRILRQLLRQLALECEPLVSSVREIEGNMVPVHLEMASPAASHLSDNQWMALVEQLASGDGPPLARERAARCRGIFRPPPGDYGNNQRPPWS